MKFVAVVICATFIFVSGKHGTLAIPPEPEVALPPEPQPITKPPPPTTTSTVAPTTTTAKTTTLAPSPAPNTTTPAPTTTTQKPTTTSPTTTTVVPITTVKPTPAPTPQTGQWVVNDVNKTCIVVKMSVQFNVTYLNDNKTVSREIVLPRDNETNASGICIDKEQVINITWASTGAQNNTLIFHFVKNGTKDYSIHHIELYLAPNELPNVASKSMVMLIHNVSEYKTGLGNSYRCGKLQRISLTSNLMNTTGVMEITDFQFQAFRTEKNATFGAAEDCAVETQDIVPIAVGCSLIILVVIVLVAYLVGRRRRQAGGYLSM